VKQSVCAPWLDRLVALDDLPRGEQVVVGCSGGADSLALLVLAHARGFDVTAVYVDHGLRPGSGHDAAVVAAAAAQVGTRHRVERVGVGDGPNLEARARTARYDALERARTEAGAIAVLVGHTGDDQAESVLLNLIRGSGTAGLAGMPARRGTIRRPLLELRRADTVELCARAGLAPVHDPMNDDPRHRRVWIRREILPALERRADRDLAEVLARQARVLRDDDDLLDALAAEHETDRTAELLALAPALARRVVRRWLGSPPPSVATVERVLAVARGDAVATELPGGDRVQRVGGRLVRARRRVGADDAELPVELALPGRARCAGVELEAWIEHGPPVAWPDGRWVAVCDADLVPETVIVTRGPAPPGSPRWTAPVVTAGGPVWLVGYGIDRRVRATSRTRRFLWLSAEPSMSPVT
jgi:tRNA(Ile)-lysidine synthase